MTKPGKKPFTSKKCPSCKIEKPRSEYYKKLDTVSYLCRNCSNSACKTRAPKYFGKYLERQNDWRREKVASDPEWMQERRQTKKALYDRQKDEINAKRRERWATDPDDPARGNHVRRDVKRRTPIWADKAEIRRIYAQCPSGFHVDHIIPIHGLINGRHVSGLHLPVNLQYLTAEENRKKYNRVTEDYLAALQVKR